MQPVAKKQNRPRNRRPLVACLALALILAAAGAWFFTRPEPLPEIIAQTHYGELVARQQEDVAALRITLRDGEGYTLEQKTAGVLTLAGDDGFQVADSYASALLSAARVVSYDRVLAQDKSALTEHYAEYGLDTPRVTVQIIYRDGTNALLRIGNSSPLADETWYYMDVEGDPRLFALDKSTAEALSTRMSELHPVTQPVIHQARLDEITFTGPNGGITAHWKLDGSITDSDAADSWRMLAPYAYPADAAAMANLRKNLTNLRLGAYVCPADPESLTAYGLDAPVFTLTLHMAAGTTGTIDSAGVYRTVDHPESTFRLAVGGEKNEFVRYVLVDGTVYLCSRFSLDIFTGMEPMNTLSRYPLMVELDALVTLTVEDAHGSAVYTLTREERIAANNELVTDAVGAPLLDVTCDRNGAPIEYASFEAAWEQLRGIRVSGLLPANAEITQPSHTTLTFRTITDRIHTLSLAPWDALHDAVIVDGTALFYLIRGSLTFDVE